MDYKGFSVHELRSYFSYNPDTGVIVRRMDSATGPGKTGDVAGHVTKRGYVRIKHKCKSLHAHRLAWIIIHGSVVGDIDHINGDKSDNRLCNIRLVNAKENARNRARSSKNTSGCTGVSWDKKSNKWHARISSNSGRVSLGVYDDIYDAIAARKQAEKELGYHKNHDREVTRGL